MLEERIHASSVILNQTTLWITGGFCLGCGFCMLDKGDSKKSTEFLSVHDSKNISVQGPELPFRVHHHSMVYVNSKTIYLIGGYQNWDETTTYRAQSRTSNRKAWFRYPASLVRRFWEM